MAASKKRTPAKKTAPKKRAAAKKPAKKASPKKAVAKKAVAKKASAKKAPAKKTSSKKAPAKKVAAKKAPAKKVAAKKAPVKKAPAKETGAKKAGAKKVFAKKALPKTPSTAPVTSVLASLDALLRERYPRSYEELGAPVVEGAIAEVEEALGVKLPDDLLALYRWKNGGDDFWHPLDASDYDAGWDWLALEDALAVRAQFLELVEAGALPEGTFAAHWLPIATNGAGDFHLYLLPAKGERRAGAVITYWHEAPEELEIVAGSLAEYLAPVVARAEKDLFRDGREDLDEAARRARSEALFAEAKRRLDDGSFAYDEEWIHGSAHRLHSWGDHDLARSLARAGIEATLNHPVISGAPDHLPMHLQPYYAVERWASEALGDLDAVVEATRRMVEGASSWSVPREWEAAARMIAGKGDWERALAAIDQAIAARAEPLSLARRVVALARLGRLDDAQAESARAIEALTSAIDADEGTADGALVRAARATLRALRGDDLGAAEDRAQALAIEEDAARWVLEGDVLLQLQPTVASA